MQLPKKSRRGVKSLPSVSERLDKLAGKLISRRPLNRAAVIRPQRRCKIVPKRGRLQSEGRCMFSETAAVIFECNQLQHKVSNSVCEHIQLKSPRNAAFDIWVTSAEIPSSYPRRAVGRQPYLNPFREGERNHKPTSNILREKRANKVVHVIANDGGLKRKGSN